MSQPRATSAGISFVLDSPNFNLLSYPWNQGRLASWLIFAYKYFLRRGFRFPENVRVNLNLLVVSSRSSSVVLERASVFVEAFLSHNVQINLLDCVVQIQQNSLVTNLSTSASPFPSLLPSHTMTPTHKASPTPSETRRHSRLTDYTIIQYSTYVRSSSPSPHPMLFLPSNSAISGSPSQ
jgi:hypothetical protein